MKHIIKKLKESSEYQGYFLKTLGDFNKKFGTKGLKGMSQAQKDQFFSFIEKNYKAKTEGAIKNGTQSSGTIEVTFEANVSMADTESIKNHIAFYLDNLLRRDKKYTFKVAQYMGAPKVKVN